LKADKVARLTRPVAIKPNAAARIEKGRCKRRML